jgi:spermidine synthase
MLSCLPYLFKPDAKKVMIIGLGIGITSKSLADVGVPEIDIVEISPEVTNVAADAYAYVNDNILAHENISITIEDGRSYLFRSKKQYDLIICNAAHPRLGNALYTEEYYRLCREKLQTGGILCQWMPTNWIKEDEFKSLIKACADVFSQVTLWQIAPGQTIILASSIIQRIDYCQTRQLFNRLNNQGALTSSGIDDVDAILAGLLADNTDLRKYIQGALTNTDIFPRIEYSRFVGNQSDRAILEHLSAFRVSYSHMISFENCPELASGVLKALAAKNAALRKELE